jgi:hypothetical protein
MIQALTCWAASTVFIRAYVVLGFPWLLQTKDFSYGLKYYVCRRHQLYKTNTFSFMAFSHFWSVDGVPEALQQVSTLFRAQRLPVLPY